MSSIDHFDLRSFDLNLLVAFDALMQERTVTRAAARLKIGQPAMSHSLATLRLLMQDELFVRVGQTMQPTARALAIAPRVRHALEEMQHAIRAEDRFDPATHRRTFRIGFSSEMELLLLPDLVALTRHAAPGIRLLGRATDKKDVYALLDDGTIDVAVGCYEAGAQRHRQRHLFEPELMCCFNADLLPLATPIGLDAYHAAEHALVSLGPSLQGCLDEALTRIGVSLNVVMAGSEFLTILAAVAEAPLVATLPARMLRRFAPRFGLTTSPLPLALDLPPVSMVWSARSDRDAAAAWLRDSIVAVLGPGNERSPAARPQTARAS
jgi:LysR family transcriptional activator of mexEF-oprN operon